MDCYSCNGCKNVLQGKDVPLPPTTVSPGHPTDGSPYSVKGLPSADLNLSGPDIRNMATKGGGDPMVGKNI